MIKTDKRTPVVLVQSASGDVWATGRTEQEAVDKFIKAGAMPGWRGFILAADPTAHLNSACELVFRQRGPVWEVRLLGGGKLEYMREVFS